MLIALTSLLFVLVVLLGVVFGTRWWARPHDLVDRLAQASAPTNRNTEPSQSMLHKFLDAAGRRIGSRDKDRDRVLQELARGGFRKPGALNLYSGSRVAAAMLLFALSIAICSVRATDGSTLIMASLGGAIAGYCMPGEFLRWRVRRRKKAIQRALPNTLDLLTICVESGLGLDHAILHVSRELGRAHPEIAGELAMINFETRAGKARPDALRNLARRTGVPDVKELTSVLIQADRFGTSVAQTLRAYSSHLRVQARQRAEEKAAQLSVKLVFPIFFFILPSLFTITVGPVVVKIFQELLPMMNSL